VGQLSGRGQEKDFRKGFSGPDGTCAASAAVIVHWSLGEALACSYGLHNARNPHDSHALAMGRNRAILGH